MVGDVNLFLPDGPAEDVECEIMIAGGYLLPPAAELTSQIPTRVARASHRKR